MTGETAWIGGRRAVVEALRAGTAVRVAIAAGRDPSPLLDEVRTLAKENGVPLETRQAAALHQLVAEGNSQGVAAEVRTVAGASLEDLLRAAAGSDRKAFLLALDQVQDPHNLGALVRTAEAAGVQGVVIPERRAASLTPAVAKSSAGAINYVPVVQVTNLARALDTMREEGIWVAGVDGSAQQSIFTADLDVPICLVVGSEGSGLRRLTRQHCDFLVRLPMLGHVESLNASVAGGIAMYEVLRQRQK